MPSPLFFPHRTKEQKAALDKKWQEADLRIRLEALAKREERGAEYNVIGSMPDYFPHCYQALFMIKLKLQRIESGLAAGENPRDGILDAINYLVYLGAMLEIDWWEEEDKC